jgi:anti-sigma factor RsiW
MNPETQHLDFLISQYVDGSLETSAKKSVEQQLLTDPQARRLYADHRETQDLLDDFGSRIPLVNWSDFDQQLESRLQVEAREKQRALRFRQRLRPLAAAAALAIAATLGYAWHAWSYENAANFAQNPSTLNAPAQPITQAIVQVPDDNRPHFASILIAEPSQQPPGAVDGIAFNTPSEQMALQALQANVAYGLGCLPNSLSPAPRGMVVGAGQSATLPASATPDNLQ